MGDKQIRLKIKRQEKAGAKPYWEEFVVPYTPGHNIISVLMEIQRNPVNAKGEKTTPVVWECNCLEEICGACTMLINGQVRQACSALVDTIGTDITLEPMSKFPTVRDLHVDRQAMFEALKKVTAWIPVDGTYDMGEGPRMAPKDQEEGYRLAKCMTCGCCMEACPQFNNHSTFLGPSPIAQVRLFNLHPTGAMHRNERLETLMGEGGIAQCGNAQNCVRMCPKEVPITKTLAELNKDVNRYGILGLLKK
ncbi:MAG: succinate dehydrogenase iron-sulfur subunit [Geobacteraceae bacterium]|nr:succinate dehydrogenase iron-sulfur subunit [Geobacteraceae bacterium]